ncbi:YebC-like protein [Pseudovirgaria hyperparasitica]|uniref:YebC-like protein n=1 Tax=Pseudovirgaria hyperparasitica TaxID=470096 RepID=A0A6A6VZD7_9PEZI|nr:YebC-like protein [Pseudovirgaria hyperparasitica]KAF2755595.1 YebC-like protein [Pseudovirgaria hyperparasitica]
MRINHTLRALRCSDAPYIRYASHQIRAFRTTCTFYSGHSRWSKIKHDKAQTDARKSKARQPLSRLITAASKFYGPDPTSNLQLANAIAAAKKQGLPKDFIESAIARGQGVSSSGKPLTSVDIEALFPGDVAVIVECETDNKNRTVQDVKTIIKDHGGSIASILYLFERKGRIEFKKRPNLTEEYVLEAALEAGALDVEDEADSIVVYTEATETKAVATALAASLQAEVESVEVLWTPKSDTLVNATRTAYQLQQWEQFTEKLSYEHGFQRLYTNEQEQVTDA